MSRTFPFFVGCLVVLLLITVGQIQASSYSAVPTLVVGEPTPLFENTFSYALAGRGGAFLATSIGDFDANPGAGYLFDAATGDLLQTYTNPSASNDNFFGGAIAFVGEDVAIAASEDSSAAPSAGRVYLFDRTQATTPVVLASPVAGDSNLFGSSIAALGSNLVIGEEGGDPGIYTDVGAAYLYDTDPTSGTFGQVLQTYTKTAPVTGDAFGAAVAVVDGKVVVGAPRDGTDGTQAGAVYVFEATGALVKTLRNPTPSTFDRFGSSIAAVGKNILVGAPLDLDGGTGNRTGAAFLFNGDSSSETFGERLLTIPNPTPADMDRFGQAVTGSEGNIFVGAMWDDTGAEDAGAVYLFDGDPASPVFGDLLQEFQKQMPPIEPAAGDWFGWSLAVVGGSILVGAQFDDQNGVTDSGSAYLFSNTPNGTNVESGVVADDGTPVTMTFDSVTTTGITTAEIATCPVAPGDFDICDPPVCLDITTTATFGGNLQVCINYGDSACPLGLPEEAAIRLLQDGMDITDRPEYPDTNNHIVCGTTTHLSLFEVLTDAVPVSVPALGAPAVVLLLALLALAGFRAVKRG